MSRSIVQAKENTRVSLWSLEKGQSYKTLECGCVWTVVSKTPRKIGVHGAIVSKNDNGTYRSCSDFSAQNIFVRIAQ